MHHSDHIKIKLITIIKQRKILLAKSKSIAIQSLRKPLVEPQWAKPKTNHQAPTYSLKLYEEAVIESEARTTVVQLKSEASSSIMIRFITRHAVCRIIYGLYPILIITVNKFSKNFSKIRFPQFCKRRILVPIFLVAKVSSG